MVKVKNKAKKKGLSDKLNKKEKSKKALNPFEVRVNRSKFHVLGRKSKNDWGLPGVARAKSIKKRKETLLQEFKVKDKTNRFVDRRIGEKNAAMTEEDRIMARFAAEKVRAHNKKTIFNLADSEVLTHRGQTLSEIEKFDDPRSDDEDDEDKSRSGKLDGKFVEEAHFGGGIFTKGEEGTKTRAALIDELIAESKKRKAERQLAREETLQLTEKLDTEWKDLLPLVNANSKEEEIPEKRTKESYDMLMRELKFESRGIQLKNVYPLSGHTLRTRCVHEWVLQQVEARAPSESKQDQPSDRLKSEEEIAKEEKERLEKLEEERIKRMKGFDKSETKNIAHRSADDLDDGFDITSDVEEDEPNKNKKTIIRREEESEASSDDSEDETEQSEDGDGEEVDDGGEGGENEQAEREKEENTNKKDDETEGTVEEDKYEENSDKEEEAYSAEEEEEFDFDLSDLRSAATEESDHEDSKTPEKGGRLQKVEVTSEDGVKHSAAGKDETCTENKSVKMDTEKFKQELMERKKCMEEARKELPYTFKVPESFEEFQNLMSGRNIEEQAVIIERMIKCNHPSLGDKNREKLSNVFAFLLQHLNDADGHECWTVLDRLSPFLFDLTQFSPNEAAHCVCEVLKEKHNDFKQKPQRYPASDTLVFLQLVALLFPTSDTRHQVTTPATVFLSQILHQCRIKSTTDIASGLLVTTILLEYISLSKRFCVEAVNFLRGCLCMAVPGEMEVETLPPFKPAQRLLVLAQSQENLDVSEGELRLKFTYLSGKDQQTGLNDSFRVCAMYTALQLILRFAQTYEHLPASSVVFKPLLKALKCVQVDRYPKVVRDMIDSVESQLTTLAKKKLSYVVLERKRPKALKLYEPDIQPVYDRKTWKNTSEEKKEHDKLVHKYKKEMKGALREIRRDRSFLAKIKFKNQAKSDEERMKKVKQIYSWGATQQNEIRKLKRKK